MTKLFISYRSLDSSKVDAIVARLRSAKRADGATMYTIWQDKTSILDGHDWWESIVDAIIDCDIFVLMVSRESVQNANCRAELNYARKRNRPVIAFVLEGEFFRNPMNGKNDIEYWRHIPQELEDNRSQFLFYENTTFLNRVQAVVEHFRREPRRWRDLPAERPPDPRRASDETNNTISLYNMANDYALRLEFHTSERLFQKLVNMLDPDFGEEAGDWILLLRRYKRLIDLDRLPTTRHRVRPNWETYIQLYPSSVPRLFDPIGFSGRFDNDSDTLETASLTTTVNRESSQKSTQVRSQDVLLSPFEWIEIPAGRVTINDHTEIVSTFFLAKYPVTNAQYNLFIDAKGYDEERWWTETGWKQKEAIGWSEPRFWNALNWNGAEQPVVGVSWYEAVAFCRWLSEVSGEFIMLPTEQQWQRAAQGDDGRIYPWGGTWDFTRCNNSVNPWISDGTTPVTQYEGNGDSYFNVVDMAGNIWEWCRTAYYTGSQDLDGSDLRVLRGGSWCNSASGYFRCDYRYWYGPNDLGFLLRGFRISRE